MNIVERFFLYSLAICSAILAMRQGDLKVDFEFALAIQEQEISHEITGLKTQLEGMLPRLVTVTAYSSSVDQTDSTPFETAFLEPVCKWCVAISRDLFQQGWLKGDSVYLFRVDKNGRTYGIGRFDIEDIMKWDKKNHFDIWVPDVNFANEIGIMKNVQAILIKKLI